MSTTRDPRHDPYPGDALRMDLGDILVVVHVGEDSNLPTASALAVRWCNGPGSGVLSLDAWRRMMEGTEVVRVTPAYNIPPAEYVQ